MVNCCKMFSNVVKRLIIIAMFLVPTISVLAQKPTIIENLRKPYASTGDTVSIHQEIIITDIVGKKIEGYEPVSTMSKGWSVQVFSDNSQAAKDEAFKIENKIKERMPYEYVRSERHTPFWKVRVGQFDTAEEAQELKELLIREFPELKGGIYVVKFNNN